jgi:hypothetical protein
VFEQRSLAEIVLYYLWYLRTHLFLCLYIYNMALVIKIYTLQQVEIFVILLWHSFKFTIDTYPFHSWIDVLMIIMNMCYTLTYILTFLSNALNLSPGSHSDSDWCIHNEIRLKADLLTRGFDYGLCLQTGKSWISIYCAKSLNYHYMWEVMLTRLRLVFTALLKT